jgi:hypothetical protein
LDHYVYDHIKHYDRKCPKIIGVTDEMLARQRRDDVFGTCQRCENRRNLGIPATKLYVSDTSND